MAEDITERFMRYCAIPSQSNPASSDKVPSTPAQHIMARVLEEDLLALGALDVCRDEHAYVIAHWPSSPGLEQAPCLGLIAHLDTAWQAKGDPGHPQLRLYEGKPLVLCEQGDKKVQLTSGFNPELQAFVGQEIVTSDGTSLLGGDDKAGVAEIFGYLERLKEHPDIPHPPLAVAFVPDEEIGHGAALLDLESFGAAYGYTLDAGPLGECAYETFNAATATVTATGCSVHPGTAKGRLVNALEVLVAFHRLLPASERPEYTEGREGFFLLVSCQGNVEHAQATYGVRDHDLAKFEKRKHQMEAAAAYIDELLGEGTLKLAFEDVYRNMGEEIEQTPELVDVMLQAYEDCGVTPHVIAMRGGTDGSQLTFRGLPCPNISSGYYNAHGPLEFVPVHDLRAMVDVLEALGRRFAQQAL